MKYKYFRFKIPKWAEDVEGFLRYKKLHLAYFNVEESDNQADSNIVKLLKNPEREVELRTLTYGKNYGYKARPFYNL